jgi:hypothetical protein
VSVRLRVCCHRNKCKWLMITVFLDQASNVCAQVGIFISRFVSFQSPPPCCVLELMIQKAVWTSADSKDIPLALNQEMELCSIPVVLRERNTNLPSSCADFLLHVRMSLHERLPNVPNIEEQLHFSAVADSQTALSDT